MKNYNKITTKKSIKIFVFIGLIFFVRVNAYSYPLKIIDDRGKEIIINKKPENVVSLVPSVTEVIFKLSTGDVLKAITYHSVYPVEAVNKKIVGGFLSPSLKKINQINPDLIFISKLQKEVIQQYDNNKSVNLINIETDSILDSFKDIRLIGKIFQKEKLADDLIKKIKKDIEIISEKVKKIPIEKRKRVIRIMGRDIVMTPGIDSFQNELIQKAGCISHNFNRSGNIINVSKDEWVKFNPQIIYGCGNDKILVERFLTKEIWKDVDAVKNNLIFYYPCELTCRASTNTGYFISWLAANAYGKEFSIKKDQYFEDKIFNTKELHINLDYVKKFQIAESYLYDFVNRTLIIDFKTPQTIISSLEGIKKNVLTIGNHYSPPQTWGLTHNFDLLNLQKKIISLTNTSLKNSSFLFTGADIKNYSLKKQKFKDMEIYAIVTAGVNSNAMRMSKDIGLYYEPGTINIIILSNMKLSIRAMTRAIITATEGKTAALLDLDIRSSYNRKLYRATGTGTDNIIIVQGNGVNIDNSGGHTKIGELIGKSVYEAVKQAIYKQNGFITKRNIFQRLKEREITIMGMLKYCDCGELKYKITKEVEEILLEDYYANFLKSAFIISDDYEKGMINDISSFHSWCKIIAQKIALKKIDNLKDFYDADNIPLIIKTAVNAILNGVYHKMN